MVFLTEILASPAPWLPASEHPPATDPKATRTQRQLSQGRSPSEGQRAPRGDARDPPRRPTLPSPDPKRGAYLSGPPPSRRITPPPSSALTSPGGDDPEMLEGEGGEDASRGGGNRSGIATAPYPNRARTTAPRDAPTAAFGPFPRL